MRLMKPIGVTTRKNTMARITRVLTKDNASAKAIHALFGQRKALGKISPSHNMMLPSARVI